MLLVAQKLLAKCELTPDGCWRWTAGIQSQGYGQIMVNGKNWLVHRFAYTVFKGEIPDDLTVDHLCRVRRCANPLHLRLLTNVDNASDNGMASRTHCPAAHRYDEDNTYVDPEGHRRCRQCARDRRLVGVGANAEPAA